MLRAADIEARALFVPGGLYGSVRETLGPLAARASAAGLLVDRIILGALAAVVAGHYAATLGRTLVGVPSATIAGDAAPLVIAAACIALVWWTQRQGRSLNDQTVARLVGAGGAGAGV